jgi:hypothetical protein
LRLQVGDVVVAINRVPLSSDVGQFAHKLAAAYRENPDTVGLSVFRPSLGRGHRCLRRQLLSNARRLRSL